MGSEKPMAAAEHDNGDMVHDIGKRKPRTAVDWRWMTAVDGLQWNSTTATAAVEALTVEMSAKAADLDVHSSCSFKA